MNLLFTQNTFFDDNNNNCFVEFDLLNFYKLFFISSKLKNETFSLTYFYTLACNNVVLLLFFHFFLFFLYFFFVFFISFLRNLKAKL